MSFTRLHDDICNIQQYLHESIGPGTYKLTEPNVSCYPCFVSDPHIRMQRVGASISKSTSMIDIDSEMIGINRVQSRCPEKKYMPTCDASYNCDGGAGAGYKNKEGNGKVKIDYDLVHMPDCFTPTEDTRLSNPPATLRETGWNRWEWLCKNPQERIMIPYDYNVNSKLVIRDNHRPCIPTPLNQSTALPVAKNIPLCSEIVSTCAVPTTPSVALGLASQVPHL
jgi:hypothetical protein